MWPSREKQLLALFPFQPFNLFMAHNNDPRDNTLESSFTIPQTWRAQDNLGSSLFCPSPPLHAHSLERQLRRARDFGHVSRRSHHGHPEQVTTVSIPYHHPLTHIGMLHRILAWPSLLLGLSAWINQHPLRTREGATPPIGNLMYGSPSRPSCLTCGANSLLSPHRFAATALIASYLPYLLRSGPPAAAAKQVPLDI
jgi:hypothetical protein